MAKTLGGNFQFGHLRDLDVKQIWDQFRYIEYWWLNPVINPAILDISDILNIGGYINPIINPLNIGG